MLVTLGQQYNIGEKPTVMLYTYINHHAGTPDENKQKHFAAAAVASVFVCTVYVCTLTKEIFECI